MDEEIKERVFQQMMDLWIIPEIKKRKHFNKIPDGFILRAAQVIFSLDRGWSKVRLNEEIKAQAVSKLKVPKKKGEAIYEHEIEDIQTIKLTDDDPNCAHLTLLQINGRWIISFDFTYNRKRIVEHINAAKEFFDSAKDNLDKKRLRPFFENSFACAELLAKSILLQLPDKKILHDKKHSERIKKFRNWAELGNVKKKHSKLLEKLKGLRSSARYLSSTNFEKEDSFAILQELEEMMQFTERTIVIK